MEYHMGIDNQFFVAAIYSLLSIFCLSLPHTRYQRNVNLQLC